MELGDDRYTLKQVALRPEGDSLIVTGGDILLNRQARLFFRSILGAQPVEGGWRCPKKRAPLESLFLQVNDWLVKQGYKIERHGEVASTVERDLERRRSFERTRIAAARFREAPSEFDFSIVNEALSSVGWSTRRELRQHQKMGLAHAITAINAANFSVPGSGKTATALAVAATHLWSGTVDLIVVIGPLACFDPWEQEVRAALGDRIKAKRVRGTKARRVDTYEQVTHGQLLLLSYATAVADRQELTDLLETFNTMLVVDESHRIKRFRGGAWAPALLELAKHARVRHILSGTPMPQSARDLYTQLNILWPDGQLTGARDAFAARVESSFDKVIQEVRPFVSRTPKQELNLPPYDVVHHSVELSGLQREIYELIEGRFKQKIEDAEAWRDKIEVLRRARPIRLLQAASNPSLLNADDVYFDIPRLDNHEPSLMERLSSYSTREVPAKSIAALNLVRSIAESKGKVVCWSNFVHNLDQFSDLVRSRLRIPCFQIDGRIPAGADALHDDPLTYLDGPGEIDTREVVIRRFLRCNGPAVLVTNPASCSESISLHQGCFNAIYIDRTYDCALFLQSIDRVHRLGLPQDVTVTIHILLATLGSSATIDHLVDVSLANKEVAMKQLLEGADLRPIELSDRPSIDAEGTESDLEALLRFLIGEHD